MATDVYINIPEGGGGGSSVSSLNGQTGALTLLAGTNVTIVPGAGTLTINSTSSGSVTAVTASSPLASSGGTTPNITIQNANTSQAGALTATDWNTFNNKQNTLVLGNLTDIGTDGITITGGTGSIIGSGVTISQHVADVSHNGYLSQSDWSTFNNKLSPSQFNYITNSDAEINTVGWNLYNDSGRAVPAFLVSQDLTYTSTLSGNGGNGVEIEYIYNASFPAATPNINVISPTHVQVQWNNGPTISNNPTATQLQTAWNAVPAAVAIATVTISGSPSKLQYITGASFLGNGGDASPTDGIGGVSSGVTFTRNTSTPLVGIASFDLGKIALSEQGQGVSTDFVINTIDKGKPLQITFAYEGSSGMILGSSSDVQVFIYDINNTTLIPVTPLQTITGPVSTAKTFSGVFTATTSSNYRLILHIATTNANAWDLLLDSVFVTDQLSPVTATQVPSLVLLGQPISGAVTDHMVVMWIDGATQWVPATIAGAALSTFGTDQTQLGFATNIVGSTASIYVGGSMDGFSFGPFTGFQQYIDNTAGGISPLPSPFTDLYVIVGTAISSTVLNIGFVRHVDLISNGSGVPIKGGLLTSSAVNDGTGDVVLSPGANNSVLVANSAAAKGLNFVTTLTGINTTGSAATLTTPRTIAGTSFNGSANITLANKFIVQGTADAGLSGPQFLGALATGLVKNTTTTGVLSIAAASDVTGQLITGYVSGSGVVAATDSILQAIQKLNGNTLLKANSASPTFTGDINSSTGNVLISTIGKGLSVKTGANAKIGTAVLAAGTVTVANTSVTANSRIFVTSNTDGGTPGWLRVSAKTVATSFVITSSSATDTSTVAWMIVESIP